MLHISQRPIKQQLESLQREFDSRQVFKTQEEAIAHSLEHCQGRGIIPFRGGWAVRSIVPPMTSLVYSPSAVKAFHKWAADQPNLY